HPHALAQKHIVERDQGRRRHQLAGLAELLDLAGGKRNALEHQSVYFTEAVPGALDHCANHPDRIPAADRERAFDALCGVDKRYLHCASGRMELLNRPEIETGHAMHDDSPAVIETIERRQRRTIEQLIGELHGNARATVAVEAAQGSVVTAYLLVGMVGALESVAVDGHPPQLAVRQTRRRPRLPFHQREFAERLPGLQPPQLHDAAVGLGAKHPHPTREDDIELAAE